MRTGGLMKTKRYQRLWKMAAVITALEVWGGNVSYARAQENVYTQEQNVEVTFANNQSSNTYGSRRYDYYSNRSSSYLIPNEDGTLTRFQYYNGMIQLENYDENLNLRGCKSIPMELDQFGGFFSGEQYNWIVFGQNNPDSSDNTEVFRIVKYSKNWERLGDCRLTGHNTTIPFRTGNCRMAEYGGILYVRTSHEMYGGHQANVMLEINEETMTLTDYATDVSNYGYGYVSHSFDQFVDTTDGELTAVDLGDAHPRAIVWFRYENGAADEKALDGKVDNSFVLPIAQADTSTDDYAYNATGVSIGGYQVSADHYLVAYRSVDQSSSVNQINYSAPRNIYVAAMSRGGQNTEWNTVQITDCTGGEQAYTPQFVKVADDKYLLTWESVINDTYSVKYCMINGAGQQTTQVYTWKEEDSARISNCVPVIWNNKAVWYTADSKEGLRFYLIDCSGSEPVAEMRLYTGLQIDMDADTAKYYNPMGTYGSWNSNRDGTWDGTHYYLPGGQMVRNAFFCDGNYTYYLQADGTPMKDRLTYHPDGVHIIYFDRYGHEVFSNYANITMSIAGAPVDDLCFFDTYGYMYVDTLTYDGTGTKLYYVNPYGVLERNGWFQFSGHEFDAGLGFSGTPGGYGYARGNCSLLTDTYTTDWNGNYVYVQGDGHVLQ